MMWEQTVRSNWTSSTSSPGDDDKDDDDIINRRGSLKGVQVYRLIFWGDEDEEDDGGLRTQNHLLLQGVGAEKMSSVLWQRRLEVEEREVLRRRSHLKQVLEEEEEENLRKRSHWEDLVEQENLLGRWNPWKEVLEVYMRKSSHWEEVLKQQEVVWKRTYWKEMLQESEEEEVLKRRSHWKEVVEEVLVTVELLVLSLMVWWEGGSCRGSASCPAKDDNMNWSVGSGGPTQCWGYSGGNTLGSTVCQRGYTVEPNI